MLNLVRGSVTSLLGMRFAVIDHGGQDMIAVKRILVPYDFSDTSAAAVRYATSLARLFGARLFFLHVGDQAHTDLHTEFPIGLEGAVEDAVRERLLRILSPREQSEFHPEFAVRAGSPVTEIVRYATVQEIDLIVMGPRGTVSGADGPTPQSRVLGRR
jgi:nucleotide-binding universal stress UspA family protein